METRFSPRAKLITFWVLAGFAAFFLVRFFGLFTPFFWAMITAYIVQPLIATLARYSRLPRPIVATVVYIAGVALLIVGIITAAPIFREQVTELIRQVPHSIDSSIRYFETRFPDLAARLGLDSATLQRQVNEYFFQFSTSAPRTALTFAQQLLHLLLELLVYLFATFFLLVQGDRIVATLRRAIPFRYAREADRVLGEINQTLGAYLRGQILLVLIMSTVTYVALSIYQIRFAFALALATGFLELIPLLGPWTAGAIAVAVALLDSNPPFGWSNLTLAIVVAITYFVLRQLEDVLVIPTLIGRIVHLHPLLIILCVTIGTAIGGILGLLLAVPLAAVARIVVRYLHGKLIAEPERRIVLVASRDDLTTARDDFAHLTNFEVVLVIQSGVLAWADLPDLQSLVSAARYAGADLTVVTTDSIAGSLFTALGTPTTLVASAQELAAHAEAATPAPAAHPTALTTTRRA